MAAGLGLLRLTPAAFWAMTPRELERAMSVLEQGRASSPLRAQLESLMTQFPDRWEPGHG